MRAPAQCTHTPDPCNKATFTRCPAHLLRSELDKPLKENKHPPQILGNGKAIWEIRDYGCVQVSTTTYLWGPSFGHMRDRDFKRFHSPGKIRYRKSTNLPGMKENENAVAANVGKVFASQAQKATLIDRTRMTMRSYSIGFVGDICLSRGVITTVRDRGPEFLFQHVRPLCEKLDFVVGNLKRALLTNLSPSHRHATL